MFPTDRQRTTALPPAIRPLRHHQSTPNPFYVSLRALRRVSKFIHQVRCKGAQDGGDVGGGAQIGQRSHERGHGHEGGGGGGGGFGVETDLTCSTGTYMLSSRAVL